MTNLKCATSRLLGSTGVGLLTLMVILVSAGDDRLAARAEDMPRKVQAYVETVKVTASRQRRRERWHISDITKAARALGDDKEAAAHAMFPLLGHRQPYMRKAAIVGIGEASRWSKIGPAAKPAALALIGVLEDRATEVRKAAIQALSYVFLELPVADGEEIAPEAMPALIKALEGKEDGRLRYLAASLVARFGRARAEAVPALVEALSDRREEVQIAAMGALDGLRSESSHIVPTLVAMLHDGSTKVRKQAAQSLRSMGGDAASAGPGLVKLLDDENFFMRQAAREALHHIAGESDYLLEDLVHEAAGASGLRLIGVAKAIWFNSYQNDKAHLRDLDLHDMARRLIDALDVEEDADRNTGLEILGNMARRSSGDLIAELVVPVLAGMLSHESSETRLRAARELSLGQRAVSAIPALESALSDQDARVREQAARTLAKIGS